MNKRVNPRYIGIKNTSYKPYYHRISYLKTGIKTVTAVGKPEKYKTNGRGASKRRRISKMLKHLK